MCVHLGLSIQTNHEIFGRDWMAGHKARTEGRQPRAGTLAELELLPAVGKIYHSHRENIVEHMD